MSCILFWFKTLFGSISNCRSIAVPLSSQISSALNDEEKYPITQLNIAEDENLGPGAMRALCMGLFVDWLTFFTSLSSFSNSGKWRRDDRRTIQAPLLSEVLEYKNGTWRGLCFGENECDLPFVCVVLYDWNCSWFFNHILIRRRCSGWEGLKWSSLT